MLSLVLELPDLTAVTSLAAEHGLKDTKAYANVKKSTSPGKLSCFLKWGCPPISLFFEKSGITIVERAKHLPITAGASCFPDYYERRFFYDNL